MKTMRDGSLAEESVVPCKAASPRRGRVSPRGLLAIVLLATWSALAMGCSGSSPSDPVQNLVLEGDLVYQGRQSFPVIPGGDGVLRIEVVELTPLLVQVGGLFNPNLSVGVGLGRPVEDLCLVSASFVLAVGGKLSFSLENGDYCVQIFDSGALPPDATIHFVVLADVS